MLSVFMFYFASPLICLGERDAIDGNAVWSASNFCFIQKAFSLPFLSQAFKCVNLLCIH